MIHLRSVSAMSAIAFVLLLITPASQLAHADWPSDPAANLPVATRVNGQVVSKIAATPDGGAFVGWFDNATGGFRVRLQRIDAAGNLMWGPDGLLVSSHPSMSFIVDWDMLADSAGNAVLVFSDIRDGGDLDVHAYRIDPAQQFLWGPDGITISANADFEPDPRVVQTTDGDFVIVWPVLPDNSDGHIMMQRLAPDGTLRFPFGGIPAAGRVGESPGFCQIVASDNGSVIAEWVRDISSFFSNRFLEAQKFDSTGTALWNTGNPVSIFDAMSVPIAYRPQLLSDGAGGGIFAWHRSNFSNHFDALIQRVNAAGTAQFAHNGLLASTNTTRQRFTPSISHDTATDDVLVFFTEQNLNQSAWGIYGQRISVEGSLLWTNTGRELVPLSGTQPRSFVRSAGDGAGGGMVFWFESPTLGSQSSAIKGMRVDSTGTPVWNPVTIDASSVLSSKDDLNLVTTPAGMVILSWQDNRNDSGDQYAQNVNIDGTLGIASCPVDINNDGVVDVLDFFAFIVAFNTNDPAADLNNDGIIDVLDFFAFIIAFNTGCP